jgi:hypothetical protein
MPLRPSGDGEARDGRLPVDEQRLCATMPDGNALPA